MPPKKKSWTLPCFAMQVPQKESGEKDFLLPIALGQNKISSMQKAVGLPTAFSICVSFRFAPPCAFGDHFVGESINLYGTTLRVELLRFIRPEQRFPDIESLKTQIERDIASLIS